MSTGQQFERPAKIGAELFGRPAEFDTSNDGVVRVRAAEVRKRLAQYYREATSTSVHIEIPPESYVPEFHWSSLTRVEDKGLATALPVAAAPLWRRKSALVIVIGLVIASVVLIVWFQLSPNAR